MIEDFFTLQVLNTYAGATAAVIVVVEAIKKIIGIFVRKTVDNRIWISLALVVSFVVSFGITILNENAEIINYIIAFLNSFAIFGSATAGFRVAKEKVSNKL